jgi:CheY-like chemotaxis protein
MTEEQRASLFAPFVRLDTLATRKVGGTGLGLAISKRLVEAMPGGRIGARSTPGVGSTFWFDVELPPCAGPPADGTALLEPPAELAPMRILVAEDYLVSQMIIGAMLQRQGHIVTFVEDGRLAVDAVVRELFDLVLMDMEMPVMKGVEATRAIRALGGARAAIPIIALTANAMPNEIQACLDAGMNGHLSKPISAQALWRQLARWGTLDAPRSSPRADRADAMRT